MIDHIVAFLDELEARDHPVIGKYYTPGLEGTDGTWNGACCIPNLFAWDPAMNTQEEVTGPGGEPMTVEVRHPFDDQWRIMIALAEEDTEISTLSECEVVADREAAETGTAGWLIKNTLPLAVHLEPTFMGSAYDLARAAELAKSSKKPKGRK